MSSGSNNFTTPTGRDYVRNTTGDRINYPSIRSFQSRFSSPEDILDGNRGVFDPWRSTEETFITGPLGLFGFHVQPHSPMQIFVLNNSLDRQSPPGLLSRRNFEASTSTQEDSRLTQAEQIQALKQLKKEMYNPVPKRISTRLCLYYRDQATNILNQKAKEKEEDGKSCAVCLEDFEPKEMVMLTPCKHMFHEECIVPWVKSNGQCPVCRFALYDSINRGSTAAGSLNNNNTPAEFDIIYYI